MDRTKTTSLAVCRLPILLAAWALTIAARPVIADDAPPAPQRIELWPDQAPLGDGGFEKGGSFITVYLPAADIATGAACIICPGGGYGGLADNPEGHGIAKWLLGHGIAGIVLNYRLPAGRSMVPLLDAQRAIRLVRSEAKNWKIDPSRVGIMGFSAGGHLASTAETHFDAGDPGAADLIDRESSRPDFAALIYPVITMGQHVHEGSKQNLLGKDPKPEQVDLFSNEKQVTDRTPPTFLAHAKDDRVVVPENSRDFYAALQAHHVPSQYLELPEGGHGLSGYQGPMWDAWQKQLIEWLAAQKMTPR